MWRQISGSPISRQLGAALASGSVLAHGYISQPGRNYLQDRGNSQCGAIRWEPTGPLLPRWPARRRRNSLGRCPNSASSAPGLSSAGPSVKCRPVPSPSGWTFTAPAPATGYCLTKQGLETRPAPHQDAFDLNPFCVIDGNMGAAPDRRPISAPAPRTRLSGRSPGCGVEDTASSFYNLIDAGSRGTQPPTDLEPGREGPYLSLHRPGGG